MAPLARLEREYAMTLGLRGAGVAVPRIVAVSPDVRIIVKEFVEGSTLSKVIDDFSRGAPTGLAEVASYGRLMARVHNAGFALGDAKASNVIITPSGLYLTDLEQTQPEGDRAWDLAEFVYYTAKLSNKEGAMTQVAKTFLDAYQLDGPRGLITKASSPRYLRPFQPFLLPAMAKSLKDLMTGYD